MLLRTIALVPAFSLAVLGSGWTLAAEPNTLSEDELAEGWILLFDGESTFGWSAATKADWKVENGVVSVSSGEPGLLHTTIEFSDFRLRVDFRAPAETNSGVFVRTPPKPIDPAKDCYEINIAPPSNPFPTASIVARSKAVAGPAADEWRTLEIMAFGNLVITTLDGETAAEYADREPVARGHIGLQLNSGKVEFRNIKLLPLGLQSIFNGRDLSGWKVFPDKQSEFSVTPAGQLAVRNGPGALESEGSYGDFVLQLDAFSGGEHLNSGIFFRSIPGEFCNGYESQIHNGFKNGDRTQPIDGGTGAIYRRQPARKVVPDDFAWFHKTLVAGGDHMAVWVNGYQVTDWTDTRPPDENPRKGLRTKPGTLMIQGHDPTTDLMFRNLRIAELPAE